MVLQGTKSIDNFFYNWILASAAVTNAKRIMGAKNRCGLP